PEITHKPLHSNGNNAYFLGFTGGDIWNEVFILGNANWLNGRFLRNFTKAWDAKIGNIDSRSSAGIVNVKDNFWFVFGEAKPVLVRDSNHRLNGRDVGFDLAFTDLTCDRHSSLSGTISHVSQTKRYEKQKGTKANDPS